jgi:hypothetical protein
MVWAWAVITPAIVGCQGLHRMNTTDLHIAAPMMSGTSEPCKQDLLQLAAL